MTDHDIDVIDDEDDDDLETQRELEEETQRELERQRILPRLPEELSRALVDTLRENIRLRDEVGKDQLREDVIRNAVGRSGEMGARKLLELAHAENERLQVESDALPRNESGEIKRPDKHGREYGHPNYGMRLKDWQLEKLRDVPEVMPGRSTGPAPKRKPRNLDEALADLAQQGLLAPEQSQLRDDK